MRDGKLLGFKNLYVRIAVNDFLVNSVGGIFAAIILGYSGLVPLSEFPRFLELGLFVIAPLYVIHLLILSYYTHKGLAQKDEIDSIDLRSRIQHLMDLLAVPSKGSRTVPLLWLAGGVYGAFFCGRILGLSAFVSALTLVSIVVLMPPLWLVDAIVVRRCLLSTIRQYMDKIPESSIESLKFYRMSSLSKSALAVFYLVLITIYFVILTSVTGFTALMDQQIKHFGEIQLTQIVQQLRAGDVDFNDPVAVKEHLKRIDLMTGTHVYLQKETDAEKRSLTEAGRSDVIRVERHISTLGTLVFVTKSPQLYVFKSVVGRGLLFFLLIMVGIGTIVIFQVGREFRDTLSRLKGIVEELARGDFAGTRRMYATDEFWQLYQRVLVIKKNSGQVLGGIREGARTLNDSIRVVEEVSQFLQELSGTQEGMVINAGDAAGFVDNFAASVKNSIGELSNVSETTSSTATEFAASINQIKNSMHKLVGLSEKVAESVREGTGVLKNIAGDAKVVVGLTQQVEAFLSEFRNTLDGAATKLGEMAFSIDKREDSGRALTKDLTRVSQSLSVLEDMHSRFDVSKTVLNEEMTKVESIVRIMDDFIEQTEILALNAAIIAAKTDSRESGFGVIADEVKGLAEKTGSSTVEIRRIVDHVLEQLAGMDEETRKAPTELKGAKEIISKQLELEQTLTESLTRESAHAGEISEMLGLSGGKVSDLLETTRLIIHQMKSVGTALDAEVQGTERLTETSNEMKLMAEQVTVASQEQTVGANQIAGASESIRDLSIDAKSAIDKLKESMSEIVQLLDGMQENAISARKRSDDLRNVVDEFSREINWLSKEVSLFRLPGK